MNHVMNCVVVKRDEPWRTGAGRWWRICWLPYGRPQMPLNLMHRLLAGLVGGYLFYVFQRLRLETSADFRLLQKFGQARTAWSAISATPLSHRLPFMWCRPQVTQALSNHSSLRVFRPRRVRHLDLCLAKRTASRISRRPCMASQNQAVAVHSIAGPFRCLDACPVCQEVSAVRANFWMRTAGGKRQAKGSKGCPPKKLRRRTSTALVPRQGAFPKLRGTTFLLQVCVAASP